MSFIFDQFPSQIYPAPTGEPKAKDLLCKAVKLTSADFTTGGAASLKAYMPADASIVSVRLWTKTTFAGNGVSALSLQIGITGTVNKYVQSSTIALTGPSTLSLPSGAVNNFFGVYDPTAPEW
jgi:hypothetical protein